MDVGFAAKAAAALSRTERTKTLKAALSLKLTEKEIKTFEDDDGPKYLLPSNGGYNPKQRSIFVQEQEE